jgi:polyisoprenoid-binding protein YceI
MRNLAALLLLALAPAAAGAASDESRVAFTFRQMNVPVEGSFRNVRAELDYDAAVPERSRADIEVELASIDTGTADGDTEAQRRLWFDTAAFPRARFASTAIRRVAPDRLEIVGTLAIKGRSLPVTVPVNVRREKDGISFDGRFTLKRLAFGIGEGVWADTDTVADDVEVRFHFVTRAPGARRTSQPAGGSPGASRP